MAVAAIVPAAFSVLLAAVPCHAAAAAAATPPSIESGEDGILITVPAGAAFMIRSAHEDGTYSAPERVVTESTLDAALGALRVELTRSIEKVHAARPTVPCSRACVGCGVGCVLAV